MLIISHYACYQEEAKQQCIEALSSEVTCSSKGTNHLEEERASNQMKVLYKQGNKKQKNVLTKLQLFEEGRTLTYRRHIFLK